MTNTYLRQEIRVVFKDFLKVFKHVFLYRFRYKFEDYLYLYIKNLLNPVV